MGSSKKTYVSSQTYNMSGSFKDRVQFAKTVVVGAVLRGENDKRSMGEIIVTNYINGPGIQLKNAMSWFERNDYWGVSGQTKPMIRSTNKSDEDVILPYLPKNGGKSVKISETDVGTVDVQYIVYKYMFETFPEFYEIVNLSDEELEQDYGFLVTLADEDNNLPANSIEVKYKGTTKLLYNTYSNLDIYLTVLYAYYTNKPNIVESIVTSFPTVPSDWNELSNTLDTITSVSKKNIITTYYSDGSVEEVEDIENPTILYASKGSIKWGKTYSDSSQSMEFIYKEELETSTTIEDLPIPGIPINPIEPLNDEKVIVRKTKETFTYTINEGVKKVIKTSSVDLDEIMGADVFIYKFKSGNSVLDGFISPAGSSISEPFYPTLPFRAHQRTIGPNWFTNISELNDKAFKKLVGQKYSEFTRQVNSSSGIGDINTGYIQLGVALNTKDPVSKEYLFKFFLHINQLNGIIPNEESWLDKHEKHVAESLKAANAIKHWYDTHDRYLDDLNTIPPGYRFPRIPRDSFGWSVWSGLEYQVFFNTDGGKTEIIPGVIGKKGTINISIIKNVPFQPNGYYVSIPYVNPDNVYVTSGYQEYKDHYTITKQTSDDTITKITVYEPVHRNYIRDGKSTVSRAFDYNDGNEESSCIAPLSYSVLKSMSLKDVTQLSVGCKHPTFTAWKVVKKKWYQTGLFKIVMVVVIIVVSIYFPPAGATAGGILGSSAAVGAAIGLTGAAALIVGAALNAIAGMVVASIISVAANKLFGAKIGAIVSVVASIIVNDFAAGMQNGQGMAEIFNGMMNASNVMSLTSAVGKGYLAHRQEQTLDILKKTEELLETTKKQLSELDDKMFEEFGASVIIDPTYLTDVFGQDFQGESSEDFLNRTLMTGSDVAETTFALINDFASINLNLDQ